MSLTSSCFHFITKHQKFRILHFHALRVYFVANTLCWSNILFINSSETLVTCSRNQILCSPVVSFYKFPSSQAVWLAAKAYVLICFLMTFALTQTLMSANVSYRARLTVLTFVSNMYAVLRFLLQWCFMKILILISKSHTNSSNISSSYLIQQQFIVETNLAESI